MAVEYLFYPLIGMVAGFLAGLMGVGGGLIIVPSLWFVWTSLGWDSPWLMQLALGTSLTTIIFTSLSSIYAHHQRGGVVWRYVGWLMPGLMVGAIVGNHIAVEIEQSTLVSIFCVFGVVVACKMAFGWKAEQGDCRLYMPLLGIWGIAIGVVSALVGIGGGTLTVPTLRFCRTSMTQAVGTSAACGFPIALAGSMGAIWTGYSLDALPSGSLGLVYWPAALCISVVSVFFAPMGAKMAHRLSALTLQRIFAAVLLVVAIRMWLA